MADATLDAGAENCGRLIDLVVEAMAPLQPGQSLAVVAYDASSQVDLAAWCRMTGHQLRFAISEDDHLTFVIEKVPKAKEETDGPRHDQQHARQG
jgi:TusA-related sulfurtransferase